MKKSTMMALSIIAVAGLSACASAETTATVTKTEAPQAVDAPKAEAPKVTDTQKKETPPTIGKRGLKLPNAATGDKPGAANGKPDKANLGEVEDCEGAC